METGFDSLRQGKQKRVDVKLVPLKRNLLPKQSDADVCMNKGLLYFFGQKGLLHYSRAFLFQQGSSCARPFVRSCVKWEIPKTRVVDES